MDAITFSRLCALKVATSAEEEQQQLCNLSLGNFTTVGTIYIQLMPMVLRIPTLGLAKSSEVLTSLGMTKILEVSFSIFITLATLL